MIRIMRKRIKTPLIFAAKGAILAVLALVIGIGSVSVHSYAEENISDSVSFDGTVAELAADVDAYESPDETSQKKTPFTKGSSVFVVSSNDGWCEILYKNEIL